MNTRNLWLVYSKELRDSLRDRRTMIWSILFPVLAIPLLMFGMIGISAKLVGKARQETVPVVLTGESGSPGLAERLREIERFDFVEAPDDVDAAIGEKRIRLAIDIPPGFDRQITGGDRPVVRIRYHDGEFKSETALRDVQRVTETYRRELVVGSLAARGLDAGQLEPFAVEHTNVASRTQVSGQMDGGIVPYMIILMCLVGAMFPAIDLTAGEKERGTMETILASAVGRIDLVLGKFLTVMTTSMSTVFLSLASLAFTGRVIVPRLAGDQVAGDMKELVDMIGGIDPLGIVGLLVLILPLTMLFSAVLMTVALFARSYREAQQYVGPLPIVVIVPAMIGLLPGTELGWKTALIPITGTSLAGKELLAGSFDWVALAVIFVSSCLYAGLALIVATKLFQREEVLFRT